MPKSNVVDTSSLVSWDEVSTNSLSFQVTRTEQQKIIIFIFLLFVIITSHNTGQKRNSSEMEQTTAMDIDPSNKRSNNDSPHSKASEVDPRVRLQQNIKKYDLHL